MPPVEGIARLLEDRAAIPDRIPAAERCSHDPLFAGHDAPLNLDDTFRRRIDDSARGCFENATAEPQIAPRHDEEKVRQGDQESTQPKKKVQDDEGAVGTFTARRSVSPPPTS